MNMVEVLPVSKDNGRAPISMPLNTLAPLPSPKKSQKTNILLKRPLLQKPTSEHPAK